MTVGLIQRAFLALLMTGALCGCEDRPLSSRAVVPQLHDDTKVLQQDDLTVGMEFLHQINEPAAVEIDRLALYHINQWLGRASRESSQWEPAGLTQYLPKSLAAIQPMQELERNKLTRSDLDFLHGRIWQRDLGRWLVKRPLEKPWSEWIAHRRAEIGDPSADQLAVALHLFDWTVRNIQLDAFPEEENKAAGTATGEEAGALPPQRGVPGPGYQRYPYETMLYGHGDAFERSRVFIELCRQQGIESIILALNRANEPLRPWAVAILIGDELYLFDAELGLPLPGRDRAGVVTLGELVLTPELLKKLDVDDKRKYWVHPDDLKSLRPLISASPEELSRRMWLLEKNVSGSRHLDVFVDVDAIAAKVTKSPPLAGTKPALWRVPFECVLYELGRGLRLNRDREFALNYDRETLLLRSPGSPLRRARQLQFMGQFDTSEEALARRREQRRQKIEPVVVFDGGAVEVLLQLRPESRAIEDLAYSEYWQQVFGIAGQIPKDPQQRREFLDVVAARIQKIRDDTTYWLGIISYEKGDHQNAAQWFSGIVQSGETESTWLHGARYNLGRCYEALGDSEQAVRTYRADDSPQEHGNRLRAKWLPPASN